MREQQRAVYRSMQGKEVDMNKIINANEMTIAVGNMNVNARGDEIGPGGQIVRKAEEVQAAAVPINAIPDQINVRPAAPVAVDTTPAPAPAAVNVQATPASAPTQGTN